VIEQLPLADAQMRRTNTVDRFIESLHSTNGH
jgi:hypothetical protein